MLFLAGFLEHFQKGFLSNFLYVLSLMYHQEVRQREKTLISNVIPEQVQEASLLQIDCHVIISVLSSDNRHGKGRTLRRCHNESYIPVITFLFVSFYIMSFMKDSYWKISIYDPFLSFFTIQITPFYPVAFFSTYTLLQRPCAKCNSNH